MRMHTLPVDAGAFHDHQFHAQLGEPGGQGAAVAPKAAELAAALLYRSVGLLDHDGHHVQHAVHIDTGDPPVQGLKSFHRLAPVGKVQSGTQGNNGREDSSGRIRPGPLYRSCCDAINATWSRRATVGGASQPAAVRLGVVNK